MSLSDSLPPLPCDTLGCEADVDPSPTCPVHSPLTRIPCDFSEYHAPHVHGPQAAYLCTGHPGRADTLLGVIPPEGSWP